MTSPSTNCVNNGGKAGSEWQVLDGGANLISSGFNVVWAVNRTLQVFYRRGISDANPIGIVWENVGGYFIWISVNSVNNEVWSLTDRQEVVRRLGISATDYVGVGWSGVLQEAIKVVSVGQAGVWTVNSANVVFYRIGTGNGIGGEGTGWELVDGSLKQVSSGDGVVWGVDENNNIFKRTGINDTNPTGIEWEPISDTLSQVSVSSASNFVWGLDGGSVYQRMF
ncbi:PREDICTED: tectonin beta-propeller repeat-containing protein 1-like [Priapulus caudatus]|uniref:Tectonin beta-propeller repeat-containing protein 1-like n=1 Tax=Priapulus caudatus TaxID=37621 RepID=A0ABM1ED50_PRICU|nr:PREDICTED: tectonin beta-propeller repeat-containing protein 1-like [Priapulus caudatus]